MKLVIVESPAKAKTIGRFLGNDYEVLASFGHVRDLPGSAAEVPEEVRKQPWARFGVDVANDFAPVYVVSAQSKKHLSEIKKRLKGADKVVLATDEDREGEAISWHLLEVLQPKVPVERIVFHEITREAISEAIAHPRVVDDNLVRAQETRRILDRLFGYSLSPVLWKKVRPKLSAGRVQSVAVRLVVEREEERRAFKVSVYWDLEAAMSSSGKAFTAALLEADGKRVAEGKDFDSTTGEPKNDKVVWLDEAAAEALATALRPGTWKVVKVEQKGATQRPYPPFITSTLQQAASSVLGFSPRRTMQIAQRLYEGVDLGGGEREGLITYMRTDSVTLSGKALAEAGVFIRKEYGDTYYDGPRFYSRNTPGAQEAHEAIRPTHLGRKPEEVARYVDTDELKLYRLIWNRTIASQMVDAQLLKTTADIDATGGGRSGKFRANGSVVKFQGFLRVADSNTQDAVLPELVEGMGVGAGQALALDKLDAVRHETKPPARYTEATLVKRLEEDGIGRPSTYAPTISLIQDRGYVELRGKALLPTFVGIAVVQLLRQHFSEYVDLKFTARMEGVLDKIAEGNQNWVEFLRGFYLGQTEEFGHGLEPQIAAKLANIEFPAIALGNDAEDRPLVVRLGRTAAFVQRGEGGEGHTATIPSDVSFEELSVAKAEELIAARVQGDEALGVEPTSGLKVYCILGPYGPYVQLGEAGEGVKPKRASLPKGTPIGDVTLQIALNYLSLPRELGLHPESGKPVRASIGPFGPYVVCERDFRSLKKEDNVFGITFERAMELLSQPKRGAKELLRKVGERPGTGEAIEIFDGRYGPYVTDGTANVSLPKQADPAALTLEEALRMLAEAPKKEKTSRRKAPAKKAAAKKPAAKKPAAKKKAAPKKKAAAKKPSAK